MDQFIGGKGIFTISFLLTIVAMCAIVIAITFVIQKIRKSKLLKEIKLAKIIHKELSEELFSSDWEKLKSIKDNPIVSKGMEEHSMYETFDKLVEVLKVSEVLISEFDESEQNGLSLKEANVTMSFINSIIDSNDEEITEFNEKVRYLLVRAGYTSSVEEKEEVVEKEPVIEVREKQEETSILDTIRRPQPVQAMPRMQPTQVMEVMEDMEDKLLESQEKTERNRNMEESIRMENNEGNVTMSGECSVFANGLVINGDVTSKAPLLIKGEINGNVESDGNIELSEGATITGNVTATAMNLNEGKITGDVKTVGNVYIGEGTYIKGSLYAESLVVEGFVEGNITANAEVKFTNTAKVLGDINAVLIDIEKGAKVSGNFNIGENAQKQQ